MLHEVFVEILECLGMSLIPQPLQKGREHSQPWTGQGKVGEDVESTADVSTKASPSPRGGQANYCAQHWAGNVLWKRLFPRCWDKFPSMRDPSATGKSTMETEHRFHCLIPFYRHLPEKAHFPVRELQIYLGQVHTGASNIGQHFAFSFFWLLVFLSGKQEMPRILSFFLNTLRQYSRH